LRQPQIFWLSTFTKLADVLPALLARVLPSPAAALDALLKDRFAAKCALLGVRTPRALDPSSLEEVEEAAEGMRYPVIHQAALSRRGRGPGTRYGGAQRK